MYGICKYVDEHLLKANRIDPCLEPGEDISLNLNV